MAEEYLALQILADERNVIAYRPKLAMFLGSVTGAILLQQIFFRFAHHDNQEFYKFREACSHKLYKAGDSWCEELGFTTKQFDTALGIIGTKIEKGKSKADVMKHEVTGDEFSPSSLPYLVVYWTDSNRITWYWLNRDLLGKCLKYIYLYKNPNGIYLKRAKRAITSITETTPQTTTETTNTLPSGGINDELLKLHIPDYLVPVFHAVREYIFGINETTALEEKDVKYMRAIAQVARTKAGKEFAACDIASRVKSYAEMCERKGYTPPQSKEKFGLGFLKYMQNKPLSKQIAPPTVPDPIDDSELVDYSVELEAIWTQLGEKLK